MVCFYLNTGVDAHDREILQSLLSGGHYQISQEDRAALESVIDVSSDEHPTGKLYSSSL
jgi:hypothetical protein